MDSDDLNIAIHRSLGQRSNVTGYGRLEDSLVHTWVLGAECLLNQLNYLLCLPIRSPVRHGQRTQASQRTPEGLDKHFNLRLGEEQANHHVEGTRSAF